MFTQPLLSLTGHCNTYNNLTYTLSSHNFRYTNLQFTTCGHYFCLLICRCPPLSFTIGLFTCSPNYDFVHFYFYNLRAKMQLLESIVKFSDLYCYWQFSFDSQFLVTQPLAVLAMCLVPPTVICTD